MNNQDRLQHLQAIIKTSMKKVVQKRKNSKEVPLRINLLARNVWRDAAREKDEILDSLAASSGSSFGLHSATTVSFLVATLFGISSHLVFCLLFAIVYGCFCSDNKVCFITLVYLVLLIKDAKQKVTCSISNAQ
ncbi:hypothetical protein EDC96DRAFT_561276 [Choanephora cucurbitarum]|nr:hypothetical protein EDC96DRAFT_561276 [Choanephora cucurbitarum]